MLELNIVLHELVPEVNCLTYLFFPVHGCYKYSASPLHRPMRCVSSLSPYEYMQLAIPMFGFRDWEWLRLMRRRVWLLTGVWGEETVGCTE